MTSIEYIVRQTMKANVEFITHVKDVTFKHISGLLDRKGNEYSNDENRFENFLEGADVENTTPEKVLWFFVLKHFLSIKKFIRETETPQRRPLSQWTEKIDDIITYMILLKAIVAKRQEIEMGIRSQDKTKPRQTEVLDEHGRKQKELHKRFSDAKRPSEKSESPEPEPETNRILKYERQSENSD